jgi:hypothetical protein
MVYGVMLGGLLVMPFGVYHSISEPYIVGSLWGYQLPIGYVGVLLGILAVLYPKLGKLKTLRFSSLMIVIGVSLLSSFALIPSDYFINLLHGTSFSPSQIDVDFALGNSVVLGLALLSIVFGLGSFIRGWLPKPACATPFPAQASQKPKTRSYAVGFVAVCAAVFLSMGAMHALGLGAYDSFAAGAAGALATIVFSILLNRTHNQSRPPTEGQKRAAAIIALANAGMAILFLGTYFFVNPNLASSEVTLGLWVILLLSFFIINNLLGKKFKKQTGLLEGV